MNLRKFFYCLNKDFGTKKVQAALAKDNKVSLCDYVNSSVYAGLACLFTILVLIILLWVLVSPLLHIVTLLTVGAPLGAVYGDCYGISIILLLMEMVLAFAIGRKELKVWPRWFPVDTWFSKKPKVKTPKQPSFISQWVDAKKNKYCPMLDFSDLEE